MCGVATITWMSFSAAARAMATLKSRLTGPSSSPGRMWQWRSITSARTLLGRLEDGRHGEQQDLQVEPERPVLDVVVVPLDPVRERRLAAQPVHLRPAGDTGLHAVAVLVTGHAPLEQLDELRPLGPRPDDAHLAPQDVEELGQLVDREPPDQLPDRGTPVHALHAAGRGVLGQQHLH